jgi:hypothetical protein
MDFNGAAEQSCAPTDWRMIRKSVQRFSVLSKDADIALLTLLYKTSPLHFAQASVIGPSLI